MLCYNWLYVDFLFSVPTDNPYEHLAKYLKIGDTPYKYYDISGLGNGYGNNIPLLAFLNAKKKF